MCVCACVKEGDPLLHIFTLQTQYTQNQTHYVYQTSSPPSDLLHISYLVKNVSIHKAGSLALTLGISLIHCIHSPPRRPSSDAI